MNNMTNINPITNHGSNGALIDTAQITGKGVHTGTLIDDTGAQITAEGNAGTLTDDTAKITDEGVNETLTANTTAGGVKVLKKFVKAIGIVAAAGFPVRLASNIKTDKKLARSLQGVTEVEIELIESLTLRGKYDEESGAQSLLEKYVKCKKVVSTNLSVPQ